MPDARNRGESRGIEVRRGREFGGREDFRRDLYGGMQGTTSVVREFAGEEMLLGKTSSGTAIPTEMNSNVENVPELIIDLGNRSELSFGGMRTVVSSSGRRNRTTIATIDSVSSPSLPEKEEKRGEDHTLFPNSFWCCMEARTSSHHCLPPLVWILTIAGEDE
ncbi:hypothetical protein TanjilG_11889 [Lupinus angustifolius]|uniref:Uncharacterized protein n=1 Tax=Lupinus angustifolius TaxID=3871 RepID=A0A394DAT6_LUPAN|nr:hypothetical protein TanjilG_11889 [Lupinus angustifolius]